MKGVNVHFAIDQIRQDTHEKTHGTEYISGKENKRETELQKVAKWNDKKTKQKKRAASVECHTGHLDINAWQNKENFIVVKKSHFARVGKTL